MAAEIITITERVSIGSGKVDEEAGVIRDVKVLGEHSANGRRYRPLAMRGAVESKLYEGVAINVDHKSDDPNARGWSERIATLKNVRFAEGADGASLVGDLHARKSHPLYSMLLEDAKEATHGVGLSHSIRGQRETVGDVMEITNIDSVVSVDLVQNPATTKSLFEKKEAKTMPQTIAQFAESLSESHASKKALGILAEKHPGVELSFSDKDDEPSRLKMLAESIYDAQGNTAAVLDHLAGITAPSNRHAKELDAKEGTELAEMQSQLNQIGESVAEIVKREQAQSVLEEAGAEPARGLVTKVMEAESREKMAEMVKGMPESVLRPGTRPRLSNERLDASEEYKRKKVSGTENSE